MILLLYLLRFCANLLPLLKLRQLTEEGIFRISLLMSRGSCRLQLKWAAKTMTETEKQSDTVRLTETKGRDVIALIGIFADPQQSQQSETLKSAHKKKWTCRARDQRRSRQKASSV